MMSFRGDLRRLTLPVGTSWLLADVAEAKGRQQLHTRQSPQLLKAMREAALIRSVESSNRIEGVTVAPDRLRPLVLGQARPRDRSEEEIQGYRKALNLIQTSWSRLTIEPALLRRLHRIAQGGSGDAGEWKAIDNEIVELRPGAPPRVRFRPTSAKDTPKAIGELFRLHAHSTGQDAIPGVIAVAILVLDALCIHPFRDGNGRVARLLTLVGLYKCGYEVGRYISLERLVEDSKEDYYGVLEQSSKAGTRDATTCCLG